jgi:hypothetical protein
MNIRMIISLLIVLLPFTGFTQQIEKVAFDLEDSLTGYYLAIPPQSKQVKGSVVLLTSFTSPEDILTETKLHNVAYKNDLLMVVVPMKHKLYADSFAVDRITRVLKDLTARFVAPSSSIALAGYDEAGGIALRYTELSYELPTLFRFQPKVVFGIDTPVDLFGLWRWSEGQIAKNFWPGAVGDARFYIDAMTKENGTIHNNPERYKALSPFKREEEKEGHERFLKTVALRLYYDMDIQWQLENRRNSLYDTKIPDGSELVKRLLLSGNKKAELIAAKQPGVRTNGIRHPNALSIVDEVDCIHWIKRSLGIFDINTWKPSYEMAMVNGWGIERFSFPAAFAPGMTIKGVEDLRFAPGWDDPKSAGYWSYAYLWWLQDAPLLNAESLKANLEKYYSGLIRSNIEGRNIPPERLLPTTLHFKKIKTDHGDLQTFQGTIHMLDYMEQKPIVLNVLVHEKKCKDKAVIFELSPQPLGNAIWRQLDEFNRSFRCEQ